MNWRLSHRADPKALPLADRHYNRQKVGSPQFVPPGRCLVLLNVQRNSLWVTSWPFAEYVKHQWAGAWVCSCYRKEGGGLASDEIRDAVAVTLWHWPKVPTLGIVTFIDRDEVQPIKRRGKDFWGYSWLKAGFQHVGETQGGLMAWQLLPWRMPNPARPLGAQLELAI